MFSNLENFLNAKIVDKEPQEDVSVSPMMNANDSWDLDISSPGFSKAKMNPDDGDKIEKSAGIVPGKGQKMVAKRLKKIGDTLARGLVDTEKIEKRIEKQKVSKSKKSKTKSPPKRNTRRKNYVEIDSDLDMDDSDSDLPISQRMMVSNPRCSPRRPHRRPHDPNTIVLDCDDEFIGGPAVAFTRNIAQAESISIEDSKSLKVNVKFNNEIEQYEMNAFQKLSVLKTQISNKHNVPSDHVALMFKEKIIPEHETPNSIGYIQGLVIKALISDTANKNKNTNTSTNDNSDKLEIKIQTQDRKRPFITYINPTDQLITLAFACADEFKCDVDKVALEFDGEFINIKETAEDLALEGGEVMDFFKKK